MHSYRPTRAIIDLDNLSFNLHSVREFIGPNVQVMAVVKADAYGHGAVECARRLESEGADRFAVATVCEAAELRAGGITRPIVSFGGPWPGEEEVLLRDEITPVIFDIQTATRLARAAAARGVHKKVHLKIDTGMGRVGIPFREIAQFADHLLALPSLEVEGAMTHFAAADDLLENEFTAEQSARFNTAVEVLRAKGLEPKVMNLANSPGAVAHPDARGNLVRLGGVLYGLGGDVLPRGIDKPGLRPVMSVVSALALVKRVEAGESLGYSRTFVTKRDSIIGTVPIGYHDGFRRGLSNVGRMIVNGKFVPVVGRVSMDWTLLDLTDLDHVEQGVEAVIIGTSGESTIAAEDIARDLKTISYEVTCGISSRVPREYHPSSS